MKARLVAVRPYLVDVGRPVSDADAADAGELLDEAILAVLASGSDAALWVLVTAVAGAYPSPEELRAARRTLRLSSEGTRASDLLTALREPMRRAPVGARVRVLKGAVLVDAHFSATSRHNTGIQRVTRELSARWAGRPEVEFAAWAPASAGYRELEASERATLLRWGEASPPATGEPSEDTLLLPIGCTIVVPEVSQPASIPPLAALAQYGPNRVVVIGHDTIPVVSGDTQAASEIERFANFLAVVKHADRVVAVSESAAVEFSGFGSALASQGLPAPPVSAVPLALDPPHPESRTARYIPLVLVVGSQEPRKNHFAVLAAAERASRAGIPFVLRFLGGGSAVMMRRFDAEVARLQRAGVRIEVVRGAGDDVLARSYAEARFTCFPSLHEGFGLPVAESLAMGVPCLTSDYGSTAWVAARGGCVVVDPRDDDQLADAFASMLRDDELIAALRAEIAARPARTWHDYADEVWDAATSDAVPLRLVPTPVELGGPDSIGRALAAIDAAESDLAAYRAREASPAARLARSAERPASLARLFVTRTREAGLAATTRAAVDKLQRVARGGERV